MKNGFRRVVSAEFADELARRAALAEARVRRLAQRLRDARRAAADDAEAQDLRRRVAELTARDLETSDALRRALARVALLEAELGPPEVPVVQRRAAILERK